MKWFSNYSLELEDIKKWFDTPTKWIFKYLNSGDLVINENFFWNRLFATQEDIDRNIAILDEKISQIKKMKKALKDESFSPVEKKFLLNSLNWIWLKFILFKSSLYLEAEKAGYELSDIDRSNYLKKVNKLQNIIYWPEISWNDFEENAIISELWRIYNKNSEKLNEEEKSRFLWYIKNWWLEKQDEPEKKSEKKVVKDTNKINLSKTYLTKDKVIYLFTVLLDIYGLNLIKVSVESSANFSVQKIDLDSESENWKYAYKIVLPESKLEKTSVKRLLQLFDHEVWVHSIRWFNWIKTIKTDWDWYNDVEEWMAKMTELLFDENIKDINVKPGVNHITSFIAENFNWEETLDYIKLYLKLTKPKDTINEDINFDALNRMLRIKRFVSLKEKWANRKELSYTRWQTQVVEYFQNSDIETRWQFLKDFYFAKLSFEDVWLVKEFRESLWIDESELKYPLWIGKILYKKLLWENVTLKWLREEDFRFWIVDDIRFSDVESAIESMKQKILSLI